MRIIGGKYKGRKLSPPIKKWPVRPTMDQAKEALFNIIVNSYDLENCKVLDLFSGSGNIAFEFISRGCMDISCVERHYQGVSYIKKISIELNCQKELRVHKNDVLRFLNNSKEKYNIIFADPPYEFRNYNTLLDIVFDKYLLKAEGVLIMEHDQNTKLDIHQNFIEKRKYGSSYFSFFGA